MREVYDAASGKLLYVLPDETIYVKYVDYHVPLGCDLSSFSYCGNVYDPSASTPYRVAFSPSGDTLAILYRAQNLGNTNEFSTLRIYDGNNGKLLSLIGSYKHPVETYAYAPDGNTLIIGYVDGTVQIWDLQRNEAKFYDRRFNSYIESLAYSNNGKYLLIQRPNLLEVRYTKDGSLRASYESVTSAISPAEDLIAVADTNNDILIQQIDGGKTIHKIRAHEGRIYALAFSPDGQTLVSSGEDCAIRAWDVNIGGFQHNYEQTVVNAYGEKFTESRIFINYMRFIPGMNQLIGFGSWATVVNWNTNSGATNFVIESAPLEYYNGMMTLNPHFPESFGIDINHDLFYIGDQSYSLSDGTLMGKYQVPTNLAPGCYPSGPLSADGKLLFTRGYNGQEGHICILNPSDLQLITSFEVLPLEALDYDRIEWLYLSPDGSQLIVNTYSGMIFVYQVLP